MFSVSDWFSAMFPGRDNPLEEKYPQKWHFIDKFLYFFADILESCKVLLFIRYMSKHYTLIIYIQGNNYYSSHRHSPGWQEKNITKTMIMGIIKIVIVWIIPLTFQGVYLPQHFLLILIVWLFYPEYAL